jgi:hypothetical protein
MSDREKILGTSTVKSHSEKTGSEGQGEYHPIWQLSEKELAEYQITPFNKYKEMQWNRQPTRPGSRKKEGKINWDIELHDGSQLPDLRHVQRLTWAKKLMALVLEAPSTGVTPSPASMGSFQMGFRWLISWMAERGLQRPDQLDEQVVAQYIDDLPRFIAERNDDDEITITQVTHALFILSWLWSERRLLKEWGVPSIRVNPFLEYGINHYAKAIANKAGGWIPPLPDEVAIPLFNTAAWWLGEPAEDVIRLLEIVEDPLSGREVEVATPKAKNGIRKHTAGECEQARIRRTKRFLAQFQFSKLAGEQQQWHPPLDEAYEKVYGVAPLTSVRVLFEAVREAAALCIQGLSGIRMSELLGIESGFDQQTGLPCSVRIEISATGLYEVFILRTLLSKTVRGLPREMEWVLGLRPRGTLEEPLPVRALRVLNRLHAPWRNKATTTRLFLASINGCTLPLKTNALGAMNADHMRNGIKRFVARWVDLSHLPNESRHKIKDNDLMEWRDSKGAIIKSHMMRKSWAQFMFAVDPQLMPAIQLQFHHLSISMTDSGYIGSNPLVANDLDSVATQYRNLMILEAVMGRNPLAGKMGEQLEKATQDLAEQVKGLSTTDAYKMVLEFCEHAQLPIFFSPHGACMPVQTHVMRCQDEAGTPLLLRQQPNARARQPSLCAGCGCFVLDARHTDFWVKRYTDNWLAFKRAERTGDVSGFKVIKERAEQAGKLLKKIGVKVVQLDRQIEKTLDGEYVLA